MTIEPNPDLHFFHGLFSYLEMKRWALEKMRKCPHGSQLLDVRMYHTIYFQNLLSAVDCVSDHLRDQDQMRRDFESGLNADPYFGYCRELRNAVIHRGLDLVGAGHSDNQTLWILCPPTVTNQKRTKVLEAPCKYLRELADHCDIVCNGAMADIWNRLNFLTPEAHVVPTEHLVAFVQGTDVPELVKQQATAMLRQSGGDLIAGAAETKIAQMRMFLGLA